MCAGRDMCRGQCVLVGICGGGRQCVLIGICVEGNVCW